MLPQSPTARASFVATGAAALTLLTVALYVYAPYLGNQRIFDDLALYAARTLSERATAVFGLAPRTFPYFTIATVDVFYLDAIAVNRAVSLALHVGVGVALFALLRTVLAVAAPSVGGTRRAALAAALAALFVAHPLSAYASGYLVQRTIVFATLFALIGVKLLIDACARGDRRRLVGAALACSMAIFSKEHALPIVFFAALCVPFLFAEPRAHVRAMLAFTALCLPAVVIVSASVAGVIGQAYEPFAAEALQALEGSPYFETSRGRWIASGVVQLGLFYQYLALWIAPDVAKMSIDMRVDILAALTPGAMALHVVGFVAWLAIGVALLFRGTDRLRVVGFGMLWIAVLFGIELTTVRLQEPFVLYRSFLWAPGLAVMLAALLASVPSRILLSVAAVAIVGAGMLAHERLASMRDQRTVWEDAGAKLARPELPGAARVLFNRGLERARAGELDMAQADFETIRRVAPRDYRGPFGLGAVAMRGGDAQLALDLFDETLRLRPDIPDIANFRGGALEALGRVDEALAGYRALAERGNLFAKMHVDRLERKRAAALSPL